MFIFVGWYRKIPIIRKKTNLGKGFAQRLRRFTSSHAACNRRSRVAQRFRYLGWEKLFNSNLFEAEGNNACLNNILKPPIIRKFSFFPDYRVFRCWPTKMDIRFCSSKCTKLIFTNFHVGCFQTFFVTSNCMIFWIS